MTNDEPPRGQEASTPGLAHRFTYHPPTDDVVKATHEAVRRIALTTAEALDQIVPAGREKALMLTHLETALFWANAAVARTNAPPTQPEE